MPALHMSADVESQSFLYVCVMVGVNYSKDRGNVLLVLSQVIYIYMYMFICIPMIWSNTIFKYKYKYFLKTIQYILLYRT